MIFHNNRYTVATLFFLALFFLTIFFYSFFFFFNTTTTPLSPHTDLYLYIKPSLSPPPPPQQSSTTVTDIQPQPSIDGATVDVDDHESVDSVAVTNTDEVDDDAILALKECDLYNGTWVKDEDYPIYEPGSCPYVDEAYDCKINGRNDTHYTKWRWKPHGCDLPRSLSNEFLNRFVCSVCDVIFNYLHVAVFMFD